MIRIEDIKESLSKAGFEVSEIVRQPRGMSPPADFLIRLHLDGKEIVLMVEEKERPHLVELRAAAERLKQRSGPNEVPVVVAHFLGPNRRALLRDLGVSYFDLAGNIYLRAPGVLVERERTQNPFRHPSKCRNPFSDKASIVVRILLDEPRRSWKIREIARIGNINPGWVSNVIGGLAERGLVDFDPSKGITVVRGEDILKEWSELYDWHRNRFHHYYCHARDPQDVMNQVAKLKLENEQSCALGFQSGAYLVAPHALFNQVHVIVDGRSFEAIRPEIERQLRLEPIREGANLVLVRPHYMRSALFGARRIQKWWVVSDVQLYLDLHRYPARGEEQAEYLMEKVLRPRLMHMRIEPIGEQ